MWLLNQFDSLFHLGVCKEYPIMAKTKTPRTTSPRSKKNGNATDQPVTPVVAAAAEAPASEVRAEIIARPGVATEVKTPEVKAAVKTAEPKPLEAKPFEAREPRKTLTEVRRVVPINLEEEIRRRAYQLYEERGCTPGHENDDWLVAEREILTRYNTQLHRTASA
jgi:Protein of unknown function (DUF2934)